MTFKITACASACAFAIGITIVFASGAHAEESATASDIIVTATRSERPLNEVPASVSVIGSAQIAATPAKALDDILRRVPSVDLPSSASDEIHPTATTISMRGLGGIRALVLLGGVPLNDPFFGTIQWGRVPLEAIDHVEVVRGGGARNINAGSARSRSVEAELNWLLNKAWALNAGYTYADSIIADNNGFEPRRLSRPLTATLGVRVKLD